MAYEKAGLFSTTNPKKNHSYRRKFRRYTTEVNNHLQRLHPARVAATERFEKEAK